MKRVLIALVLVICLVMCIGMISCTEEDTPKEGEKPAPTVKYTVTFVQDGFDNVTVTVEKGKAVANVPVPQQEQGYNVEWEKKSLNNIQGNITVNAVKTPIVYTVDYELNGGVLEGEYTKEYTVEVGFELKLPMREHYTFVGWYEDLEGQAVSRVEAGTVGNKVYYARWSANSFNIKYELGCDVDFAGDSTYTIEDEVVLKKPERDGYIFGGWYASHTFEGEAITKIDIGESGERTFFAKWIAKENALVFNGNGATAGDTLPMEIPTDGSKALVPNGFIRDGYTFLGWATTENGEVAYLDGAEYTMGTGSEYTLYAVWQANENTIIFNGGKAQGEMESQGAKTGETVSLRANGFVLDGYTFLGWATAENGEVAYLDGAEYTMGTGSEYTLYAVWQANENTIIFNGGKAQGEMESQGAKTGETVSLRANGFVLDGYTFLGWATAENGEVAYLDGAEYVMGTGSEYTLYAVWQIEEYEIEYVLNGGENHEDNKVKFTVNDLPIKLLDPTNSGATFVAWYTDEALTNEITEITSLENYKLYADWCGLIYGIATEGYYGVIGYYGNPKSVVIPSYNGRSKVTGIADNAFNGCTTLESVTIPSTVEFVGENAFKDCPAIEEIDGIYYVDTWVVGGSDESLRFVSFREGTIGVSYMAFAKRTDILSITIPTTMKHLCQWSFAECERLVEVYNLASLKNYSSSGWTDEAKIKHTSLEEESIIEKVGDYYFYTVDGKTALLLYEGNEVELTLPQDCNGKVYDIGRYAFYENESLLSVDMPDTVTEIGERAFFGCENLRRVHLSSELTTIGVQGFYGCRSITSIVIPSKLSTIKSVAFEHCNRLVEIYNLSSLNVVVGATDNQYLSRYAYAVHTSLDEESILHNVDGFIFAKTENGAFLVSYEGDKTELTLPQDLNGESYTVDGFAFYGKSQITSVTIPEQVVAIRGGAFDKSGCLKEENGLYYVDKWLYDSNVYISEVKIREGTVGIAGSAFSSRWNIKEVVVPNSVKYICKSAFYDCFHMIRITLPTNLERVDERAFRGCSKLMEVYNYPNDVSILNGSDMPSVTKHATAEEKSIFDIVDEYVFVTLSGVDYLVSYWGDGDTLVLPKYYRGREYKIHKTAFYFMRGIKSVTVPGTIKEISSGAFTGMKDLETAIIEDGVTTVAGFGTCDKLKAVTLPHSVTRIEDQAFYGDESVEYFYVPISVEYIGEAAFMNCRSATIYLEHNAAYPSWHQYWNRTGVPVVYGHNNKTTDDGICYVMAGDRVYITGYQGTGTEVVIPQFIEGVAVSEIGLAFSGNTAITYIELPDGVKDIKDNAFSGCTALVGIKMPSYLERVGTKAFYNCVSLKEISLPDTVTEICEYAFWRCLVLEKFVVPQGVATLRKGTFGVCTALTSVTIHDRVEKICEEAFYNCTALATIFIPKSVTSVEINAFWYCKALTIYCEADAMPSTWNSLWNPSRRPVKWGQARP